MQKGFLFDVNKCTGCSACQIACAIENELPIGMAWRRINTFNAARIPGIPVFHHSRACYHCLDPPCMKYCPALAYSKDPVTGAVTIDKELCIGCKYCSWVCPYDAPQFDPVAEVMEKCTFCEHRLSVGEDPVCVSLCPTGALGIADDNLQDGNRNTLGFPDSGAKPAIQFVDLREERSFPRASGSGGTGLSVSVGDDRKTTRDRKISLSNEWSLVVFTLIAAWMTGYLTATVVSTVRIDPALFLTAGVAGFLLSTLHIGRKRRAHRAMLNWRQSWLSREVILFPLFLAAATLYLIGVPHLSSVGWMCAGIGFAALFAMDRLYGVTGARGLNQHSGQVVLVGLFVAGLIARDVPTVVTLAVLRLILYAIGKHHLRTHRGNPRWALSLTRVFIGLVVPTAVVAFEFERFFVYAVVGAAVGELIDRCEYYMDMEIPTPRGQMSNDLAMAIAGLDPTGQSARRVTE
ncbi:MAG: 4Fe-4S dicluster domain-containing protein [Candidatus Latescibacterota bacterium]|nr:MAG: 4Fe-4S dicluster domain-containing protein [Candidatus Latescibacterota bacterium]